MALYVQARAGIPTVSNTWSVQQSEGSYTPHVHTYTVRMCSENCCNTET